MTLADLVLDLKARVGPGVEVQDARLSQWINNNYMFMVDEIQKVNPDFFVTSATADLVSGQQEYELPDDCEKVTMVNIYVDNVWVRALPLPNGVGDIPVYNHPNNTPGVSKLTPRYYIQNGMIGILSIPDASATGGLEIWYVYTPSELTDSDSPAFSHKYHALASIGAYADYLDQNDEHNAAELMRQRFEKRVASMVESIDDSDLDSPKTVVVTQQSDLYQSDDYI